MAKKTNQPTMIAPKLPEPGSRVGVVCGPGEFAKDNAGTVLCHTTDRWGTRALVLMDRGYIHHCHGLTEVGIGTHQLQRPPARPDPATGYTDEYLVTSSDGTMTMRILVRPDADIDETFQAWDIDGENIVMLNGWTWTFERAEVQP